METLNMIQYKVVVFGEPNCGKRTLISQFVGDCDFNDDIIKDVVVDDEICRLEIIRVVETLGFIDPQIDILIKTGDGFIVAYEISARYTFEECDDYINRIIRTRGEKKVPMVLIGTKSDREEQREAYFQEGVRKAESFGIPFFETSANFGANVDETFFELIREIRKEKYNKKKLGKCHLL